MEPLPARVEWIRDRLERVAFSRVEVANKWRKVKAKADDAAQNVSADTALGAAYDAGRIACEAVLACHHVRVRSGHGHHERVFSAVAAFEIAGCANLVADSEEVRIARHESEYGSELATDEDVRHARAWMDRSLPVLRSALANLDPELAPYLPQSGRRGKRHGPYRMVGPVARRRSTSGSQRYSAAIHNSAWNPLGARGSAEMVHADWRSSR
jgi:hypothetical protein